jgi:hypothetical protein
MRAHLTLASKFHALSLLAPIVVSAQAELINKCSHKRSYKKMRAGSLADFVPPRKKSGIPSPKELSI